MRAKPLSEWHEDIGHVLWWKFPIDEPPYVGTPYDDGYPVEVAGGVGVEYLGGWPGYHTHWTPIEPPEEP
jgi:hypothetical protein